MRKIHLETRHRSEMVDITAPAAREIAESGIKNGICILFVPHTTAGITINENTDPAVQSDIQGVLTRLVPAGAGYSHLEGNADSHTKASLIGSSIQVIVERGRLQMGTWQGIYFCEFDGPRNRQVWISLTPSALN